MILKLTCESEEWASQPANLGSNVPYLGNSKYQGSR